MSRSETFSRARIEIERGLRSGHPISFLMLDIDHFKNVNDQYGYPCGDSVLANLVKHCREQLRIIDILGRVGGEEFLVVLPESSQEDCYEVTERLRRWVASNPTLSDHGSEIFITISIGMSTYDPRYFGENNPVTIFKAFYKTADQAMYKARMAGRNRVEVWSGNV
nr:GGDEF domain-containing protein [Polynucleobacter necessarius]